jgi:hypothetical protein
VADPETVVDDAPASVRLWADQRESGGEVTPKYEETRVSLLSGSNLSFPDRKSAEMCFKRCLDGQG